MKHLYRISIFALVCASLAIILPFTAASAAQYESLIPLLVDLSDWNADKAEGMDMTMGGTKMIQAMRMYTQGEKELGAMIMIGNSMMTQAQISGMQGMQAENNEAKFKMTTIDDFQVSLHHSKEAVEGAVVVVLASDEQQGATFILNYKGLSEENGLALAKKFNWKKMQDLVKKKISGGN